MLCNVVKDRLAYAGLFRSPDDGYRLGGKEDRVGHEVKIALGWL